MDRKAEIIAAAISLFGEKGLDATSMQDIARVVGISKAALYFHFESKGQLVAEAHRHCASLNLKVCREAIDREDTATGKLCGLFRALLDQAATRPKAARFEQFYAYSPTYCPHPASGQVYLYELAEKTIEEGQARGELANVPAHLMAMAILGYVFQVHQAMLEDPGTWNPRTKEDCMRLVRGMVAPQRIPEDKMPFEMLFSPIKIRDLELRNRIVMSAMGTHEAAESEDGKSVTDKLVAYHVARAKGGCGLNTVEVCAVDAKSSPHGFLSLAEDKYVAGLKKLNDAVHAAGGKTCLQLWQGGLAVASDPQAEILLPDDTPLAPNYTVPGITPERLQEVVDAFGEAARRAVEAGFDTVEFHCAHNYLPHSMLSGGLNHRTDEWGGSWENRKKFPLACIREIRRNLPDGMPLFMRIDCHDDFLEGGLTVDDVIDFCKDAKEAGVDVLNISRGNIVSAATMYEVAPVGVPNGFNVEDAARIRKETGMLTMPCGRINKPDHAEKILEDGEADLVVMARAQLADPEFCNKAREGRLDEIRYCIGCDQGCYDYFVQCLADPDVKHITCMRNPALLEEEAMALKPASRSRKVLIIGGGIGGIEAAIDLSLTGNEPVLYEKADKLGGQFMLAGVAPGKGDFLYAAEKAIADVNGKGIEVHLNEEVTPELIEEAKPDAVIIAAGSTPIKPPIVGVGEECVMESHDLLAGKEPKGRKAVVVGGGLVGYECAEHLADKGFTVDILEMKPDTLTDLGPLRAIAAKMALAQMPVSVFTETTVYAIEPGRVLAQKGNEKLSYDADVVIMAVGTHSVDTSELQAKCRSLGIPVYLVGDAKKTPGMALDAIHDAYRAVLDINAEC